MSLFPDYDDIQIYCKELRKMGLYTEAHELESFLTRDDFDYYVGLYQQQQSDTIRQ